MDCGGGFSAQPADSSPDNCFVHFHIHFQELGKMEDQVMHVWCDACMLGHPFGIPHEDFCGVVKFTWLQVPRVVGWHKKGCVQLVE